MDRKIAKRFIFTGGGSGGHVAPALAVAAELKRELPDSEIIYVGIKGKAEGVMAPKAGIPLKFVASSPFPTSKSPFALLKFCFIMAIGLFKAERVLLKFRPDVVFATGGYVSAPILFAARLLRRFSFGFFKTKILIHESNVELGKMNKWAARTADEIAVSFSETIDLLPRGKGFFSGYPVRSSISVNDKVRARKELEIPENAFVIFAFGGSQGARTINKVLAKTSKKLLENSDIYIIHGAGRPFGANYDYHGYRDVVKILTENGVLKDKNSSRRYIIKDFIDNMALFYAASDLLIIRAGAGSIMEVCKQGKPSIIIPISALYSDHQTGNARFMERAGASLVIYEKRDPLNGILTPFIDEKEFAEKILSLKNDPQKLAEMSQRSQNIFPGNPAKIIVDHLLFLAGSGKKPKDVKGPAFLNDRILGLDSIKLENLLKQIKSGEVPPLAEDELRLLKNRIEAFLSSRNVIIKSRGCRLAALAGYWETLPLIIKFATSKTEKGFVTRDAFVALKTLLLFDNSHRTEIFDAILLGLDDPYYETRFNAEGSISAFVARFELKPEERSQLLKKLYLNLKDRSFEVRVEAILVIAEIETERNEALSRFKSCYFDRVWKVRAALFKALELLTIRKILTPAEARNEIDKILITSNGYVTEYELKKQYKSTLQTLSKEETE